LNKEFAVIATALVVAAILAGLAYNSSFSANPQNESTPTPTVPSTPTDDPPAISTATLAPTPTLIPFEVTISYSELERREVQNGTGIIMQYDRAVLLTIAITAQTHNGNIRSLIYDNFYITVDGVKKEPINQLKGECIFDNKTETTVWFLFPEISSNYKLNYRDNSLSIEWITTQLTY
jgi:hypothetical protein